MSLNDPFRNYDAWLTTDRAADAAEAAFERMDDAWWQYASDHDVPFEVSEDTEAAKAHPARPVYDAWLRLYEETEVYLDRLQAESEAEYYEAEHATWEADMAEWAKQQPPHA